MAYLNTRRSFLKGSAAFSSFSLAQALPGIGVTSALVSTAATAAPGEDYKALVCVFLNGGNDGNNTIIPLDATGYQQYSTVRSATSNINLAQADLASITMQSSGRPFGLHPSLAPLKSIFDAGKMAVIANVGTLAEPLTVAQYKSGGTRPLSLFSHSDQQLQWQTAITRDESRTGWGGRMGEKFVALNRSAAMPVTTSFGGANLFGAGSMTRALSLPTTATFAVNVAPARRAAMIELQAMQIDDALLNAANSINDQAVDLTGLVNPILGNANSLAKDSFAGLTSGIANQLYAVAKMIEARATTGLKRQIFFVQIGGFDTHTNQINNQGARLGELGAALKAFYDATVKLNVANQVTSFTVSDFGRTFKAAAGGGSDHAWGNHHFVLGGAVKGGDMYGTFPQLILQGPDDVASEGRWLPTTATDQYAATLATWLGVPASELTSVVPNIGRFAKGGLGFMA